MRNKSSITAGEGSSEVGYFCLARTDLRPMRFAVMAHPHISRYAYRLRVFLRSELKGSMRGDGCLSMLESDYGFAVQARALLE